MTDLLTPEERSRNMSKIKGKNTIPERIFRSMLHKAGYRFRLHDRKLPGNPDIVLAKYRSVIFINGCFWHRHEGCKYAYIPKSKVDFWNEKFQGNMERDARNTELLKENGWIPLVVWECELRKNAENALKRISLLLQEHLNYLEGGDGYAKTNYSS